MTTVVFPNVFDFGTAIGKGSGRFSRGRIVVVCSTLEVAATVCATKGPVHGAV